MKVTNWDSFSDSLDEWRGNPVTEVLREAMALVVQRRKDRLCRLYLDGRPASEAERLALLMIEQWADDFFNSSAEDVRQVMESRNEQFGDHPD